MKLLKEWKDYTEIKKKVLKAFSKWEKENLKVLDNKRDKTIELTYGLPYTSSSDFAALWNTNCTALYKKDERYHFIGLAYTEYGEVIVVLEDFKEKSIFIEL